MKRKICIDVEKRYKFHNNVDYCVGTGRMGLALQKEYMEQLKLVQEHIGFKYIRGHGLFCDDMAIFDEYEEDGKKFYEYNYTYLDMVIDDYIKLGIKPFLELGFMPYKMASGDNTVFYWKGNTTPPKDYSLWTDMVQKLLIHLIERYGKKEVLTWPIEVWNEPNLPGFWKDADKDEYMKLFHKTFEAIKAVNKEFMVGGPAVCGGTDEIWIKAFMEYVNANNLFPDFISRHHYTSDVPQPDGHYGYMQLSDPDNGFDNLKTTREIIDSYDRYKGLPIRITEFNTSYIPTAPIHDTNQNAAYIANQLSHLGDINESYSYWTFGDIFEERGVPFTPFHGGFGLVANGCIPKPTFWTFAFFKRLKDFEGECVYKDEESVILRDKDGLYRGILWNHISNDRKEEPINFSIDLPVSEGTFSYVTEVVDEQTCNPLKLWHGMGEPANLTEAQKIFLRQNAYPKAEAKLIEKAKECIAIEECVRENGVVYFELKQVEFNPDRGYHYEKAKVNLLPKEEIV